MVSHVEAANVAQSTRCDKCGVGRVSEAGHELTDCVADSGAEEEAETIGKMLLGNIHFIENKLQ